MGRFIGLLFLIFLMVTITICQDFDFRITNSQFGKAVPIRSDIHYYDYCGFTCPSEARQASDYCDQSCRERNRVWTAICYPNGCPNVFQRDHFSEVQMRWGAPAGQQGMSGMGFNPVKKGSFFVQREFKIGEMTHYNYPISANTVVQSFDLLFSLTIEREGKNVVPETKFKFSMQVDETPNQLVPRNCRGDPCPYQSRFTGCNPPPGCPDKLFFSTQLDRSVTFELNKAQYTLALTGFRIPGTRQSANSFISDETMYSSIEIWAVITRACPVCGEGRTPDFDPDSFLCTCPCQKGICNGRNNIQLPNCTCDCDPNMCGLGAIARRNAAGDCECHCDTAPRDSCIKPRVPGLCPGGANKCCCVCPSDDTLCPGAATVNTDLANCACKGCERCAQKNFVPDPTDKCICKCGLDEKSCDPQLEQFNKEKCQCECKFDCKPDFKREGDSCGCACDQVALAEKCKGLNKKPIFVKFDPKNPTAAKCECGECIDGFTPAGEACECKVDCTSNPNLKIDMKTCKCFCPPTPPTPCPPNPTTGQKTVWDTVQCKCVDCIFGKTCDCQDDTKTICEGLNRNYVTNSTYCNCTDCINEFTETAAGTACTTCPLTDEICRKNDPRGLMIVDTKLCKCICPEKPVCANKEDIYVPETCSCRPCQAGECVCGNGIVEAGEECDPPANSTETNECCDKCVLLDKSPCLNNKCGECVKNGKTSVCEDRSKSLCKDTECAQSTCVTNEGRQSCSIVYLDEQPCGPEPKDLCLRRCVSGECRDYPEDIVNNRCTEQNAPEECGECCIHRCERTTGKCVLDWTQSKDQACNDGSFCTVNDTCIVNPDPDEGNATQPLKCVGKERCTEEALGKKTNDHPCTKWECSEARFGQCLQVPSLTDDPCPADGGCSEPGVCTKTGECVRGRKECPPTGAKCEVVRCIDALNNGQGGCDISIILAEGLPCDDEDNCTESDICINGVCKGTGVCNNTVPPGGPTGGVPLIPLVVTGAVVAAAALVAGFFIYQAIANANIMDPVSWGEVNTNQFDANPLYQEATKFGDNPLYQS